jgi:hypothetical protein
MDFLTLLPGSLPDPEVAAHPNGELAFYWSAGYRKTATVSIREDGRISFAAIQGHKTLYGSDYLAATIPREASNAIDLALADSSGSA